ncbi:hypothetical protein G4B88_001687 [Cannabis sativa]|uniref:Uncharacterized protein n=1 Tax=Cannabis sativa TaxID=3483 RepID=A0A7J6I1U4_CANSA|nr:hypothetical protein G4B88_001687 [Cannabis sativa]
MFFCASEVSFYFPYFGTLFHPGKIIHNLFLTSCYILYMTFQNCQVEDNSMFRDIKTSPHLTIPTHISSLGIFRLQLQGMVSYLGTLHYGHTDHNQRNESWRFLRLMNDSLVGPWICIRDFNEIIFNSEKNGEEKEVGLL